MRAIQWLLAFLIFSILAWVFLFTILSNHTDVARDKIYVGLESKYFEDKTGARVFTYLGVFYLVAGVVTLSFLSLGVRLPNPTATMVRKFRLPFTGSYWSILDLSALSLFFCVLIAVVITRAVEKFNDYYDWPADKMWYEVSKTLGKTAAITLLFLFIPVSKSCFWLDLFNCKFERALNFHRILAWCFVWLVVAHGTAAIISLGLAGQFKNCMWPSDSCAKPSVTFASHKTSRLITYGWTAALVFLPLVVTSLPWFRRNKFEWFYYTHFLFVPALILLHLH